MSLTHIGRVMHGLPNYVTIRCQPFSYLKRQDFVPLFDEGHVTCLVCLGALNTWGAGDGAWKEVRVTHI